MNSIYILDIVPANADLYIALNFSTIYSFSEGLYAFSTKHAFPVFGKSVPFVFFCCRYNSLCF